MGKICGLLALLVMVGSLLLHAMTFFVGTHAAMEFVWPMHLLVFGIFVPFAISITSQNRSYQSAIAREMFSDEALEGTVRKPFMGVVLDTIPRNLKFLIGIFCCYLAFNSISYRWWRMSGYPVIVDETYYLEKSGEKVRELSEQEFDQLRAFEVRGFTGIWIFFSIIPVTYFLITLPRLESIQVKERETV